MSHLKQNYLSAAAVDHVDNIYYNSLFIIKKKIYTPIIVNNNITNIMITIKNRHMPIHNRYIKRIILCRYLIQRSRDIIGIDWH